MIECIQPARQNNEANNSRRQPQVAIYFAWLDVCCCVGSLAVFCCSSSFFLAPTDVCDAQLLGGVAGMAIQWREQHSIVRTTLHSVRMYLPVPLSSTLAGTVCDSHAHAGLALFVTERKVESCQRGVSANLRLVRKNTSKRTSQDVTGRSLTTSG